MKRTLTCIVCPVGCQLDIDYEGEKIYSVSGNTCPRGKSYAETECVDPRRVITTTIRTEDGRIIPVKTLSAVPKKLIFDCMKVINSFRPESEKNFRIGDVVIENILGTETDVVVCSNVRRK